MPGLSRRAVRLSAGCAGLALLSACASNSRVSPGLSTNYYLSHAAGNYTPPGPPSDPWGPYIQIAASRFDVPDTWIRQVMRVESGGNEYTDGQLTVSAAGAMGLMQLEPGTYQEMASRYGLGTDPFNPYDNIMAGTAYIHEMYQVYGSPGFLAAYNAGPGRLDSYMNYHTPLPYETINYVAMIAPNIQGYYPAHRSDADELALNTEPASVAGGILPAGFQPEAPGPQMPDSPIAPVEVAAVAPPSYPQGSSVFTPQPVQVEPVPEPPPPPVSHPSFSIIPASMADTPPPQQYAQAPQQYTPPAPQYIPPAHEDSQPVHAYEPVEHSGWAIQVGAYDSSSNARAALGIAELSAVSMLVNGRPMVMSVHSENGTKYRARVVGLPHEDAVDACNRLSTGPTGCVVLSPESQS